MSCHGQNHPNLLQLQLISYNLLFSVPIIKLLVRFLQLVQNNLNITKMTNSNNILGQNGILSCGGNFGDAYCIRKLFEVVSSAVILMLAMGTLINIIRQQKIRQYFWLVMLIISIAACLIVNIIFCFLNNEYWLYAIQTYFYNLYYLILVGYVSKSYLLKYRQIINFKKFLLDPQNQKRKQRQRTIFYAIFIGVAILYTVMLLGSVILEVEEEQNESTLSHCQEVWYLCFEGGCLLLSCIVLFTLYKNQKEEIEKIQDYKQFQKRQRGCLVLSKPQKTNQNDVKSAPLINNPLKSLWVWISLNVVSQLFNLIESIMFSMATAPQCLIIKENYEGSNILQLIFVYLSTYLCFLATLFYVVKKASVWHKLFDDKQKMITNQTEMIPNIELFPELKNGTLSTQ